MQDFTHFLQSTDKKSLSRQFDIQPHHIQFDTNDSEASESSYESSLSSNEQNNLENAQYFRQQMSRFFINYPQLLNQELIGSKTNEKSLWGDLANDIINETKQQPTSLQGIAKRIAFYRQKTQQIDIIDLIVKQKEAILKQLEDEAKMNSQQNLNAKNDDGNKINSFNGQSTQNTYYSWKKRHEANLIHSSRKNSMRKLYSANQKDVNGQKYGPNSKGKFESSIKQNSPKFSKNISINTRVNSQNQKDSRKIKKQQVYQESKLFSSGQSPQLRNILKFQPKTDVAKQLLDQIKKHNPNDTIAIKKTIVNFLCKYRQNMKKGILSKSSLNERISKLHIEDSKELLLFCPVKKISGQTQMPLNLESNTFLEILNEISSGHLMKYWKLLQQRKL